MPAEQEEPPLAFPWRQDQSSFRHCQTSPEAGTHSRKTQVCLGSEGLGKLRFGEDDIARAHHQNFLQHLQWLQIYQPKHLAASTPSQSHFSTVLVWSEDLLAIQIKS